LRAPRLARAGGIALAIVVMPLLAAPTLGADPTVVVQPGDTLTAIARRHGLSVGHLVDLNDLADPNRIYAGQRLRIGRDVKPRAAASRSRHFKIHVVRSGATLWGIARYYGVSVSEIVAANRIANPSRIFAGQRLVVPGVPARDPDRRSSGRGGSGPRQASAVVHVASRGSTVWGIARLYGVSMSAIVSANHLADPSRIFAGQRLLVPGATPAPSQSSRAAPRARMSASMARLVADRVWVRRVIVRAADRYGVPRALALALAWQESGWQQGVVSQAGAVGVMQLMPATAEWVGQTMLGRPVQIRDARSNIAAGVRLLRHYLNRYDGDRDLVLAAYYQGQRAVDRYGIYRVSRPYIASIRQLERLFGR
jgi:LysM repeat protein